jgi:hypothetical protein
MTSMEINTVVQHFVCRIFQQAAKDLGVPVIVIPPGDAQRLNEAALQLEQVLTRFVENSQPAAH